MSSWWSELDESVLSCLAVGGPMAPEEIARRVGISAQAAESVLAMLAQEGKVRIACVEGAKA